MASSQAGIQEAKRVVLDLYEAIDASSDEDLASTIKRFTTDDYSWRGLYPFGVCAGVDEMVETWALPLRDAFSPIQRRPDIFFAGPNEIDGHETTWVCQMGHFMGLFDKPWLGIPPTGKIVFYRYVEFTRVENGKVAETAHFCDVISIMQQAGHYPLPPQTGAAFVHPGPLTHDGLRYDESDPADGARTIEVVAEMVEVLSEANRVANETGVNHIAPETMAKSWTDDMIWFGPAGIGATYTIPRYQKQHQMPFRKGLGGKNFNGHVARFAEGNYACFFGWPNLTNEATGGFLGLPASGVPADMYVVDVYRRDGDKLAENWVFIDVLWWLKMQGLDVLERMKEMQP